MTANLKQEQDAATTERLQTFDQSKTEQIAALKARLEGERVGADERERESRQARFDAACARADQIIEQYLFVCAESMRVPPEKRDWEFVMGLNCEEVRTKVDCAKTAARKKARPCLSVLAVVCEIHELRESAITARRVEAFLVQAGIQYKIERSYGDNARSYKMSALAR